MPKLKSNRGAAKRFKQTGSGRFKHKQSGNRHILTKNTTKGKRQRRGKKLVCDSDTPAIRQMLPYQSKLK